MRPRAILFDLDDTLLINDMDQFLSAYFKLLGEYAADRFDPRLLIQHLLAATEAMLHNTDPAVTNERAFWNEFSRLTGFDPVEMIPFFHRFYETRFDGIRPLTRPRPEARSLVEWAFAQGYQVAIATNPMFPLVAVERRLDWAGLGVDRFDYDLITTYENMHATKPHPAYYAEILDLLGREPDEALMVGDDWERDIAPAASLGLETYWVVDPASERPDRELFDGGIGPLGELRSWLRELDAEPIAADRYQAATGGDGAGPGGDDRRNGSAAWLFARNRSVVGDRDPVPPARRGSRGASAAAAKRDRLEEPFMPGVVADDWARERHYQAQDGRSALASLAASRAEMLALLPPAGDAIWQRRGRHTFFGPTTFLELVCLVLEHDELHIDQVRETLLAQQARQEVGNETLSGHSQD